MDVAHLLPRAEDTVRRPNSDACRSPVSGEDAPEVLEAPDLWALAGAPAFLTERFLIDGTGYQDFLGIPMNS